MIYNYLIISESEKISEIKVLNRCKDLKEARAIKEALKSQEPNRFLRIAVLLTERGDL